MILNIFFLLCTKRTNFVGNSISLPSIKSASSLLSLGTFRFFLRQFFQSKFSRKSLEIDNWFFRLKVIRAAVIIGLYTRNWDKFLRLIFLITTVIEPWFFSYWIRIIWTYGIKYVLTLTLTWVRGGGGIYPFNLLLQKNHVSIPTWNILTFPNFMMRMPLWEKNSNISYCPPLGSLFGHHVQWLFRDFWPF